MLAIVKTKKERGIELLDVPMPKIGKTDLLIKVLAGSLCGSDVHYYEWLPGSQFLPVPINLGHEFSGEVAEAGTDVKNYKAGDRIVAFPSFPCMQCSICRTGRADLCRNRVTPGLTSDGFFAEYGRLPVAANIFKIPDNVSSEAAALVEPLSVCLNAVDVSGLKMGQKAAVLGPGPIGLMTMQLLKRGGASKVLLAGASSDKRRFEIALRLGADGIIDVEKEDLLSTSRKMAGGGLDLVFEATGNPKVIAQALDMIKPGGAVILIGIHSGPAEIDPTPMVRARKNLISAYAATTETWQRSLALLAAGMIDIDTIITHRLPLEKAEQGFELAMSKAAAKVVFIPGMA